MQDPRTNPWLTKREVVKYLRCRLFFVSHLPSAIDFSFAGRVAGCNANTARVCWDSRFNNNGPPGYKNEQAGMITTGSQDQGLVDLVDAAEWCVELSVLTTSSEVVSALKRAAKRGLAVQVSLLDSSSFADVATWIDLGFHDVKVYVAGDPSEPFAKIDSRVVLLG